MASARVRRATPEDASAIARVHVDSWRTTYRGIVPDDVLDDLSYERYEEHWDRQLRDSTGERCVFVGLDEQGSVVGFASSGPERSGDPAYTGELYAIYALEAHQRVGLGRELVRATVRALLEGGHRSMLVWVLERNPARGFYEALGGRYLLRSQPIEIGGARLVEVAYGWDDLSAFTG